MVKKKKDGVENKMTENSLLTLFFICILAIAPGPIVSIYNITNEGKKTNKLFRLQL